jgi:hypothetical protein
MFQGWRYTEDAAEHLAKYSIYLPDGKKDAMLEKVDFPHFLWLSNI